MNKKFYCFLTISLFLTQGIMASPEHSKHQLLIASKEGRSSLVDSLIRNQADVNAKTESGETPLIAAALAGHTEVVKLLIEHGANVNAQLKSGDTALHCAIRHGNLPLVKILIDKEASISRPFTYAITYQQFEVASYIYSRYIAKALKNENSSQLKELLEPFNHYKKIVHLPFQDYIEQLSQGEPNEKSLELISILKEYAEPQ